MNVKTKCFVHLLFLFCTTTLHFQEIPSQCRLVSSDLEFTKFSIENCKLKQFVNFDIWLVISKYALPFELKY